MKNNDSRPSRLILFKNQPLWGAVTGVRCCTLLLAGFTLTDGLTPARAATWYVATTGNDTQPGTLAAPFRTIQRAADVMAAGDTCLIRQGIYRETVRPVGLGTASAPMIFSPYNGEAVTVSGCDVISGWQSYSGYTKKAGTDFTLQAEACTAMSGVAMTVTAFGFCDAGGWIRFNGVNLGESAHSAGSNSANDPNALTFRDHEMGDGASSSRNLPSPTLSQCHTGRCICRKCAGILRNEDTSPPKKNANLLECCPEA